MPQYLGRGKFASVPWEGKRCLSASGGEDALVARELKRCLSSSGEEKVLGDTVPWCLRREKGALMPREEKRCLDASREEKVPQYLGRGKFASVP